MVDLNKKIERQDEAPTQAPRKTVEQEQQPEVKDVREGAFGVILEGQEGQEDGEVMGTGEVKEMSEKKRDDMSGGTKDDGAAGTQQGDDDGAAFVFDEHNLPPAPKMIKQIEKALRKDIHKLEKEARKYQGGLFRKPDYPKYSETMIQLRHRTVLLKKLLSLAADAVKKLFIQMFKPKKIS